MRAGFSFIGSAVFLLLSEFYDTFANEADMIIAKVASVQILVCNGDIIVLNYRSAIGHASVWL